MDKTIHVAEARCDMPLDALDLTRIRQIYSQLADQCLSAVNAVRLDLDDVILDHRAVFSIGGNCFEAAIESVGDVECWNCAASRSMRQPHTEPGGPRPPKSLPGEIRCVALRVRVIRQSDDPLAGFAGD